MAATDLASQELLQITLADVARLAQVQRPVVSMWRTRFAASDSPFPAAVDTVDRVQRFDAEAVVGWLERTGLGNNPAVRDDVAAFARPASAALQPDEAHLQAVTALLCLKAVTGAQLAGVGADDLVDLADAADPDDGCLFREVAGLGAEAPALAAYVDQLADAAFSPARAFEGLLADRFRRRLMGHAGTALRADARRLVARVAQGVAQAVDLQSPVFVDPTVGGSDLLVEVAGLYADAPAPTVMTSDDDAEICRLVRRRLRVHDLHREPLRVEVDGTFEVGRPAVHVAHFPSPGAPSMTGVEILASIDNIVVQMDQRQLAVVLAPARVLTDRMAPGEGDPIRDGLLRSDRVRAILRLPKGLLVSSSRQPLALWVMGPAHPDVRVGDRWTVVADLAEKSLDETTVEDVVTDMVAALGDYRFVLAHAFRFARRVNTGVLLSTRGSLVGHVASVRRSERTTGADVAVRVAELTDSLGMTDDAGGPALIVEALRRDGSGTVTAPTTLGQAVELGAVRLLPGNRVDDALLCAESGAPVIGPGELTGALPWGGRRVDRLVFAAAHAGGRLTSPGDVVFCTSPRVAARVDVDGGSVVVSPARVLRVFGDAWVDRVVPAVLAADINALPPRATQWRLWPVRRTPEAQVAPLAETLSAIERQTQAARDRLGRLDELAHLVADGVTGQTVTIHRHPRTRSGIPPGATSTPPALTQPHLEGR